MFKIVLSLLWLSLSLCQTQIVSQGQLKTLLKTRYEDIKCDDSKLDEVVEALRVCMRKGVLAPVRRNATSEARRKYWKHCDGLKIAVIMGKTIFLNSDTRNLINII